MDVHAQEFVPRFGTINQCASGFLQTPPLAVPYIPLSNSMMPQVPPVQYSNYEEGGSSQQFMAQLEATEHTQRVLKYQVNVLEGNTHAVPPPQPIYCQEKPFTFVNVPLVERIEDLQRGQLELQNQINQLAQRKVIAIP